MISGTHHRFEPIGNLQHYVTTSKLKTKNYMPIINLQAFSSHKTVYKFVMFFYCTDMVKILLPPHMHVLILT